MSMKNFDRWARVYDLIHKKYTVDIDFYRNIALKAKGKVLEIACGTGRVYLELLKKGVNVYGIDISGEMLKVLKKKAKDQGLKPKVFKADMRKFKLKDKFSLIIIPFRSFLHLLTIDDQIKTLKNIKKHLKPDGKLILNFFFPDPKMISKIYGKEVKQTFKTKKDNFTIINKSYFIDEPNQIVEFTNTLIENNKIVWKDKFRLAFIYKREFELLLRLANFKKWKVYGSFNRKSLNSSKQEMIWIIQK